MFFALLLNKAAFKSNSNGQDTSGKASELLKGLTIVKEEPKVLIGGIVGGGIGAVPGALLGGVLGDWLASQRAEEYERDVVAGGVMLVIRAPELAPAAQAESMLYQLGADHVENGEVPRA